MVVGSTEREVKLDAPPGRRLPDLDHLDGVARVDDDVVDLDAVYLDTPALDLLRRGASLRHRVEPGGAVWTLKLPSQLGAGPSAGDGPVGLTRRELELADDGSGLPPALLAVVWPWVRAQEVAPVARLHTTRHRLRLLDGDGTLLAEVADDEVAVHRPAAAPAPVERFRELEVEAGPGDGPAVLTAVVEALTDQGAVVADPKPKAVRAVGAAADEPPTLPGPPASIGADSDELVSVAIRRSVARVLDAEVVLRAAATADRRDDLVGPVGAMLQAERASRALLRVVAPLADPEVVDDARSRLRRLASPLLRTHDALGLASAVASGALRLDEDDRAVLAPVGRDVERDADAVRHLLEARLASPGHLEHLVALAELARLAPGAGRPQGSAPGGPSGRSSSGSARAVQVADAAWGRLEDAAREVPLDPTAVVEAIGRLRPRARRAWVAAELVAPTDEGWAARADRLAGVVADLDRLRDLTTVEAGLRSLALGAPRDQVLALGQLVGDVRRQVSGTVAGLIPRWDDLEGTTG